MKEHMEHIDTSQMTEDELQFHYFKMYDTDSNNKIDGLELVKGIVHSHGDEKQDKPEPRIFSDEELVKMVDPILEREDKNKDGSIDYPEFIAALNAQRNEHNVKETP